MNILTMNVKIVDNSDVIITTDDEVMFHEEEEGDVQGFGQNYKFGKQKKLLYQRQVTLELQPCIFSVGTMNFAWSQYWNLFTEEFKKLF